MTLKIGYWAPLEGFRDPRNLLDLSAAAEKAGFETVAVSDHFHPWTHTGAHSFFPWIWLSSLLERTGSVAVGTACTTPTMRYHPAIVAQAFASMAYMYPGRVFISVGTGEKLNEGPVGYQWPKFRVRKEMLEEAVQIIRRLWTGQFVDFHGEHFTLKGARLYDSPVEPIPLLIAASGKTMIQTAGRLGDGILTVASLDEFKTLVLPNLAIGAKEGGRDPEQLIKMVELKVSYDEDYDKALESCRFWNTTGIPGHIGLSSDPREIERIAAERVTDERTKELWYVTTEIDEVIKRVETYVKAGYNWIQVHSSSPQEEQFIDLCGREVLPHVRENSS
jgi:coenzyme F420-dependent glucose-6-phosphate dehydrogenase